MTNCNAAQDAYGGAATALLECAERLPDTGLSLTLLALLGFMLLLMGLAMRKLS